MNNAGFQTETPLGRVTAASYITADSWWARVH